VAKPPGARRRGAPAPRNPSEDLISELDRLAPELISTGRPARLLERAEELVQLDVAGHPWAQLLVACVQWDAAPGHAGAWRQARAACASFRQDGERRGEAFASYVLGCWTLTAGRLDEAGRLFDHAGQRAGRDMPGCEVTLVHCGLGAYAEGRLERAIALSEEAVALARVRGTSRAEASALVNLGFFQLWAGEFAAALGALEQAEDAFGEVADPFNRLEAPLCLAAQGVLWALRGDDGRAEAEFARALSVAGQVGDGWYEAIARTVRAEFTAHVDPRRARLDAAAAIRVLDDRNERWWRAWAAHAAGVAAREAGMAVTAEMVLRETLAEVQTPLERARTQLELGETLRRLGRADDAAALFGQAAATFDMAGARYWAARCFAGLAHTAPNAAGWMARARRGDISDLAYQRLFRSQDSLLLAAFGAGSVLRSGTSVEFRSHNAERALFSLALAGPGGMGAEELADRLWPDVTPDRAHVLGRIRTLLWDIRKGLGADAWRIQRHGPHFSFDATGLAFDLSELRRRARRALGGGKPLGDAELLALAGRLRRPILTRWAYDEWVLAEDSANQLLAGRLEALVFASGRPAGSPPARVAIRS
jgi:tetratricopeptide (TPR) repeat protein